MSSLSLAVSMPATAVLVFVIFVDPRLVKRTKLFRQPSGPDEDADDDHATGQPQTAQGGLDPIASRSAADGSPRQSIPFGIGRRYSVSLLQGWAKRLRPPKLKRAKAEAYPPSQTECRKVGTAQARLCPPYGSGVRSRAYCTLSATKRSSPSAFDTSSSADFLPSFFS